MHRLERPGIRSKQPGVGWCRFVNHVTGSHVWLKVWWPLPRWRVGREFRWCIRPISLLILHFFSDIRFHIESTDGPEEEDQEDGTLCCMAFIAFRTLRFKQRISSHGLFNGNLLLNVLISQKGTRWIKTSLHCTVMHPLKNLWVPSSEWRDLCWATLLLIGEFGEVSTCEENYVFLCVRWFSDAVLNSQRDLQWLFCRQMAARCCQDALRASKTKEEVYHVLRLMVRLSDDIGKLCWSSFA